MRPGYRQPSMRHVKYCKADSLAERRPEAVAVGVAVDEPDGNWRDLAPLGRQGNLPGQRQASLRVMEAHRRITIAAAEIPALADQPYRHPP